MKLKLIIVLFLVFLNRLVAQTPVPGGTIDGDTWTPQNSPYIIQGDITIADLNIEAGVEVRFESNYKFEVTGSLNALGFHSDSIIFKPDPLNSDGWEGIKFKNTSIASSLKYCRIEGSSTHGLTVEAVSPAVSNCRIVHNVENGIKLKDASVEIKHCVINSNSGHGIELDASQISATNSIISGNTLDGIFSNNNNDAIIAMNSVITNNQGIGISSEKADLTIANSIIFDNNEQIFIVEQIPDVTYSAIQGATIYPGEGNINSPPEFENHSLYTLSPKSPCVDAGESGAIYNDKYFPPSLGGTRNDMGAYGGPEAYGWYPPLYVKPQIISFGKVSQDSSKSLNSNVLNYRNVGIAVSEIYFQGNDSLSFSVDKENFFLPVLDSTDILLSFIPDDESLFQTDLVMRTLSHGDVYIPVRGEGIVPKMDILLKEIDFGPVTIRNSSTRYLPILNTGSDTLRLDLMLQADSSFKLDQTALRIGPDSATDSVKIIFEPNLPASFEDSLIILSNDPEKKRVAIPIEGLGSGPWISVNPEIINFGSASVFSDTSLILTIENTGNALMQIDSLNIIGQDPDSVGFSIAGKLEDPPLIIEPDSSLLVQIGFTPIKTGMVTAQVLIKSNDPFREKVYADLRGTGTAGSLYLPQSELNFDEVPLDSLVVKEIVLSNSGNDMLIIDSLNIVGQNPDSIIFNFTDAKPTTPVILAPDSNLLVQIGFMPLKTGIVTAQLLIKSNDPFGEEVHADLSGTGTAGSLFLPQSELNFGEVPLDSLVVKEIVLSNSGNDMLIIDSLNIVGQNPDSIIFNFTDAKPTTPVILAPDSDLLVQIGFMPLKTGIVTAQLLIKSNDPFGEEVHADLSGTGTAGSLFLPQSELNFGEVPLDSLVLKEIALSNSGNDMLIIDSLNIVGQNPDSIIFDFTDAKPTTPVILEPDSSFIIQIRFLPYKAGVFDARVIIKSNDPNRQEAEVRLSGTGVAGSLLLSTLEIDYGNILLNILSTEELTLSNAGVDALQIDTLEIVDQHPDSLAFKFSSPKPATPLIIESDSSLIVGINFTPLRSGTTSARVLIKSNDPSREREFVQLSGTGIAPKIDVSLSELNFGQVALASDSIMTIQVYNIGSAELIIPLGGLTLSGDQQNSYSIENISEDIQIIPDGLAAIDIKFEPLQTGSNQADLQIRSNDLDDSLLTVQLTGIGFDSSPVSITFDQLLSTNPLINGEAATFSFIINGSQSIDSALIKIRPGGSSEFEAFSLIHQSGENWSVLIDARLITERGVEYYTEVFHGLSSTLYPLNGNTLPGFLPVTVHDIQFPWQTREEVYQMISIPLATTGQNMKMLFETQLGTYDKSIYRFFDLPDGLEYTEIENMDKTLPPGKAIWLVTRETKELSISNAQSVATNQNFELQLQQGWNLISTPFAFPVDWNQISSDLGLRYYDGTDWPFVTLLEPFKGYAVNVPADTVLIIPPHQAPATQKPANPTHNKNNSGWRLQILAESANYSDKFNYIGAFKQTSSGIDNFDYPEPLPIGDFVSLYLVPDHTSEKYSTDYRQPGMDQYDFDFEVITNISAKINISFKQENLPENYDWIVVSEEAGLHYPKRIVQVSDKENRFKVIVGTEQAIAAAKSSYVQLPLTYYLEQNYPNPFNPTTTINFGLPQASIVTINLYNILGQQINSLFENVQMDAGIHSIQWNGKNESGALVSSGIYFLQLKTDASNHYIKMVLNK